jgi:geranylgeranyl reductase family protein
VPARRAGARGRDGAFWPAGRASVETERPPLGTVGGVHARADLVVAGAGPAGVAAAITAQGRGLDVVVLDRAHFPRDKTCGDGLTAAALRHLEALGVVVPRLPAAGVHEVVLVAPDHWQVELPLPDVGFHAAVVERAHLDAALVARARAVGVTVYEDTPVEEVVDEPDGVRIRTGTGAEFRGRFVVAADGHYSSVRRGRDKRTGPDLGTWHALRQYYRSVGDPRLWVCFEPDLLPGYAWVFPLPDGRANVGFGVLRTDHDGKALKRLWAELPNRAPLRAALGPAAEPEASARAWPIPGSYSASRLSDGRVLYVGDAAGVVDPMTGEGIAQALETGALAAATIADGGDVETIRGRYRHAVDRSLGRDLRFAGALQRLLHSPKMAGAAIRAAGLSPWTRRHFARWMFEDYPRAVLFTPDRWRHKRFTPTGAYADATAGGR